MEALVILFVIAIFIWLNSPPKGPEPKKSGEVLVEGIIAVAKDIKKALNEGPKGDKKGDEPNLFFYLVVGAILLAILSTYVL
jgi:hypothetical protein